MKGVIYARESDKRVPIAAQIEVGTNWFKENNHELVKIYEDNDYSGGDWNRPEFNKIMDDAKTTKGFEFVWVWAHDRMARDTEQFLAFHRKLADVGVKVYAKDAGWIDMASVGDAAKNIAISMSSQLFRMVTSEKIKAAYQAKKRIAEAKGEKVNWGRGCVPETIKERVFGIVSANPTLGYRKIAAMLPTYKFKVRIPKAGGVEGETEVIEKTKQPSYGWVKAVLDAKRMELEAAQMPPPAVK